MITTCLSVRGPSLIHSTFPSCRGNIALITPMFKILSTPCSSSPFPNFTAANTKWVKRILSAWVNGASNAPLIGLKFKLQLNELLSIFHTLHTLIYQKSYFWEWERSKLCADNDNNENNLPYQAIGFYNLFLHDGNLRILLKCNLGRGFSNNVCSRCPKMPKIWTDKDIGISLHLRHLQH